MGLRVYAFSSFIYTSTAAPSGIRQSSPPVDGGMMKGADGRVCVACDGSPPHPLPLSSLSHLAVAVFPLSVPISLTVPVSLAVAVTLSAALAVVVLVAVTAAGLVAPAFLTRTTVVSFPGTLPPAGGRAVGFGLNAVEAVL